MTDSWLEHFEVRLDLLEQMTSNKEAMFGSVSDLAQSAFAALATDATLCTYLVRPQEIQQLDSTGRTCSPELSENVIRESIANSTASDTGSRLFVGVHPLADDFSFVCRFTTTKLVAPRNSCSEGAQAITTVMATFVSRHLLSQYESRLARQSILMDLVSQLSSSRDLGEAASIVVNDGANVLGDCRLTLLSRQTEKLQVVAVTGVSEPKQMSETLAAVESFVNSTATNQQPARWLSVEELALTEPATAARFTQSNVSQLQVVPLERQTSKSAELTPPNCCLLIECFHGHAVPDPQLVQQLIRASSPIFDKHVTAQQPVFSRFVHSRATRRLLVAGVVFAVLSLWPADFEIEVAGQIQATNWQRVYAPENGTIETVSFTNESQVASEASLLTMSNPDIELKRQRVLGDIQTTLARLASTRTNRLTGNDPQASINEQILQTQLQNLEVDKELIQQQADELIVKAPFAGTVFLRDPQKELAVRPVQRGQLLLQIVAKETDWQLELDIPDHLRQYLVNYQLQASEAVPVRYLIKASPDQDWTTTLSSVDNAVQVSGTELVCRATAVIAELPAIHQRPGTSVTARIYCGRRSLGFVWFREVIEFWHQFDFAWL